MKKINVITIDGPSASGKGALARGKAHKFGFNIQRNFYDGEGLVADGRDMGTVVFKDAKLKIFLTASPEERAKRRLIELQNLGQEVNMPDLIADIEQRDMKDSSRKLSPLLPAEDAHIIDSSNMKLEEVFSLTEKLIKKEFI